MNDNSRDKPRIGGWLICIAIGLIMNLPIYLFRVLNAFGFLLSPQYESMGSQYSGIGILFGFELLGNLVVFVFLCVVVYSFFKKKNSAPKNMIMYMLATLVYAAIHCVLGISILGTGDKNILIPMFSNIIGAGIICAIWIPYFRISKRVKTTFVN